MTPIEQARLRMPPALPMSLAPLDRTPVLVCGVVWDTGVPDGDPGWHVGKWLGEPWFERVSDGLWIHNPLGWLPLPDVLTAPVPDPHSQGPDPDCPVCQGKGQRKVFRGEPSQGHDWEPCELCSPVPPTPERHKPLPHQEDSNG